MSENDLDIIVLKAEVSNLSDDLAVLNTVVNEYNTYTGSTTMPNASPRYNDTDIRSEIFALQARMSDLELRLNNQVPRNLTDLIDERIKVILGASF